MVESRTLSVQLKFPCPGEYCSKTKKLSWEHENCTGDIYIDQNGQLWCDIHKDKSFIQNWGFKCNDKSHTGGYVKWTLGGLYSAIGNVIDSLEDAGEQKFIDLIATNIKKNWKYE